MTIKELKERLEQRIKDEKEMKKFAVCKYGEGLHEGESIALQEALFYITLLEGYHEESND